MAESLLNENKKYVGKEVTEKAIEKIKKTEEGGIKNEQETKKSARRISKPE